MVDFKNTGWRRHGDSSALDNLAEYAQRDRDGPGFRGASRNIIHMVLNAHQRRRSVPLSWPADSKLTVLADAIPYTAYGWVSGLSELADRCGRPPIPAW